MRIVRSTRLMQRQSRKWRQEGRRIGFVPTMGFLHAGHISLVKRARQAAGKEGKVVLSIYVNPTQFGPAEDFSKYPRNEAGDCELCDEAGVDLVFAPTDSEMYGNRQEFSTYVTEETLSARMEGASRPSHFRGVTTVVAKLFNIVMPEVAVFGAKDFQQAAVIQKMVKDLNFPVRILVAPTVRERDGLALSSRNKYLNESERGQATVLWEALRLARAETLKRKTGVPAEELRRRLSERIKSEPDARLDYIEFFDPRTLAPVKKVVPGMQVALAVFVGRTRLIDNVRI